MHEAVSKLVPEIDGWHGVVVLPGVVDSTVEGLELLFLRFLDLGHTIIGNVVTNNVLDECLVKVSSAHVFADLVDS